MRVALLAANGQLGHELGQALRTQHEVRGWNEVELDITDQEAVARALAAYRAEFVVNAAAYTDVDGCEGHRERAWAVNAEAPGRLAGWCASSGIGLVHFSTDYVFDGALRRPYREDDPTNPIQIYGQTKRAGELAVLAQCPQALVIRTAWLYGRNGRNFVKSILSAAGLKPRLEVVDDQRGSPTSAADLAALVGWLVAHRVVGLFHATNGGECTWYEFALRILELQGVKTPVVPITSASLQRPAPRPAYSVLDNGKLRAAGAPAMRTWEKAIEAFLAVDEFRYALPA